MTHQFRVIRLWEEPVEVFLNTKGLLPLAVLSRATQKEKVLAQVVQELEKIANSREQSNLVAATSILAGLQLDEQTIRQLMRSPVMRESTMYQAILREGEQRGLEIGRTAEGKALVLKLLTRKLGSLSPEMTAIVSNLTLERLEALGEDLLDFTSTADLESWLG